MCLEIEHQPENINEVVQKTSALEIINTNCKADQNDDNEEEKDANLSITADPIRPNDINIDNEYGVFMSTSKFMPDPMRPAMMQPRPSTPIPLLMACTGGGGAPESLAHA